MTADPAARGPWHDVRSFCNRTSLTTSQSVNRPSPCGRHGCPDPRGARRRGCSGPPQSLAGRPRNPGGPRPEARGDRSPPRTRARSRTDSRPRTRAHLRPRTPLRTRAWPAAASGVKCWRARVKRVEAGGGGGGASRDRQPAPAPWVRVRSTRRAPPVGAAGEAAWSILALLGLRDPGMWAGVRGASTFPGTFAPMPRLCLLGSGRGRHPPVSRPPRLSGFRGARQAARGVHRACHCSLQGGHRCSARKWQR